MHRFLSILAFDFFIVACVILFIYPFSKSNEPTGVDLLTEQDWMHLAGASSTARGIVIKSIERTIVHQDGSVGQPHPSIQLRGPHLVVDGDFKITARMTDIAEGASLRLYGEPPIVYDEWRHEGPSIDLDVTGKAFTARVWDGTSSHSMDMRSFEIQPSDAIKIGIERRENQLLLFANDRELGAMPDHHIFAKGTIWFGADATATSTWILSDLKAEALRGGSVKIVQAPPFDVSHDDPQALRNLADARPHAIKIGAAVSIGPLLTDEKYRNIVASQFSILTPENSMKPQFIHPQPSVYVFEEADNVVDFALSNQMIVHGHTLLYGKANPDWITKSNKAERPQIMLTHIDTVVRHFKGRVSEWDVVNEAMSDDDSHYKNANRGLRSNIWFEASGEKYIDAAFKAARAADPQAKLYLNDYGLENNGQRWDAFVALLKRLQARGVPIDGVGFEAHVYYKRDLIRPDELRNHMKELRSMGLSARISEIDVYGDDPKIQAEQYAKVLQVCLEERNCTSYTTWGVTDAYGSTTRPDRYPLVTGNSLLWDKDMKEKPAYSALQNMLK